MFVRVRLVQVRSLKSILDKYQDASGLTAGPEAPSSDRDDELQDALDQLKVCFGASAGSSRPVPMALRMRIAKPSSLAGMPGLRMLFASIAFVDMTRGGWWRHDATGDLFVQQLQRVSRLPPRGVPSRLPQPQLYASRRTSPGLSVVNMNR